MQDGDRRAHETLTEAGEAVGSVLAGAATMVDPGAILFGGTLGRLEPFIEAARAPLEHLTYARTAQNIHIARTVLDDESAVTGLTALIVDTALHPTAVDRMLATQGTGSRA